jgi:hypothetical protein
MNRRFVSLHPYFKVHPVKLDAIKAMRGKTTETDECWIKSK